MPLYEYRCQACGHHFEKIQKFSDPPVDVCPSCGARDVEKLLSSPAIQFKGSGWYITDYARKDAGKSEPAAKTGDAEAKPAPTDSKTAPKPASDSGGASASSSPAPAPSTPSTTKQST
jgi:putative FmdB family regulatory protein